MLTIAGTWLVLWLALTGLGLQVARVFGPREPGAFSAFWLGFGAFVAFLQIWHQFFAINAAPLWILCGAGALGLLASRTSVLTRLRALNRSDIGWAVLTLLALVVVANRCLLTVLNADSYVYHLPAVRWAVAYPVVTGIGNFDPFLAYGHAYTLFLAALDASWFPLLSHHVGNGLLVVPLVARGFQGLTRLLKGSDRAATHDVTAALTLFPLLGLVYGLNLTSAAADFGEFAVGLAVAIELVRTYDRSREADFDSREWLPVMFLCCVLAVTKFSAAVLAAGFWLVCLGFLGKANGARGRRVLAAVFAAVIVVAPFVLTVFLNSGYFPFPYVIFGPKVDWQVPLIVPQTIQAYITAYCRRTLFHPADGWFDSWMTFTALQNETFLFPAMLAALGLLGAAARTFLRSKLSFSPWFLVPPLAATVGWFLAAPALYYAGATLWIVGIFSFLLSGLHHRFHQVLAVLVLCFLVGKVWFEPVNWVEADHLALERETRISQVTSRYGVPILRPGLNQNCANAPVMCEKYFEPMLRFRHPEKGIAGGFTVQPPPGESAPEGWEPAYVDAMRIRRPAFLSFDAGT